MGLGISTYAYFWRGSKELESSMSLEDMLLDASRLKAEVFQICDFPDIENFSPIELRNLRGLAEGLGITLELGTRGIETEHLGRSLEISSSLGSTLLRSMVNTPKHKPSQEEAVSLLKLISPECEKSGISIALETYEQLTTDSLVSIVEEVDHPLVGICLDPANSVANLELPVDVISKTSEYVKNIHVKDFNFFRKDGWVGFELLGCPLGTGRLDYPAMVKAVAPNQRGINQIIELWVPFSETLKETCRKEAEWAESSMRYLQEHDVV